MTSFVKSTIKANREIFTIFWLPLIIFFVTAIFAPFLAFLMFGGVGIGMLLLPEAFRKLYVRMLTVNKKYMGVKLVTRFTDIYLNEAESHKSLVLWRIRLLGAAWTAFFLFGFLLYLRTQ